MKKFCAVVAFCLLLCLLPVRAQAVDMQIAGKSALLMDIATGTVLYEQNAHEKLAPASVTKVMTMLLIMEAIDSGKIGWDDTVTTSETAAAKGGSQIYLKVGETMSVTDMVKSIAVSSANDCACAMAEHIAGSEAGFVEKMNQRAKELGMNDTHFVNCTGLDDDPAAKEHLTSAYDIALMSRELMKHHPDIQKYTTIWMDTVRNGAFGLANTNKLIRFYPGATGLKTGFTANAGYCLSATAERDGLGLIAVVMGCETSQDRFAACKQLLDYGFANFALVQPQLPAENTVPVKLGTADTVIAVPAQETELLIDKSQRDSVTTQVELEPQISAPVSKGQRLGTMTLKAGEQVLAQVSMVAQDSVPKLTLGDIFTIVLRKICMAR
ncbi:MAG: D-alanyl-D-alanine carboxypeptidase [Oscillospiraceae bacterium]|nr:D-alanyl-D-alanine carboxypeptidase [Oscillospiraceae bacterium]MBQ9929782.1 D-alanyl-D-alanine carboxypeptidase [Oscillospiraceae bacterium]